MKSRRSSEAPTIKEQFAALLGLAPERFMKLLLKMAARVDIQSYKDEDGYTLLHRACQMLCVAHVKVLLLKHSAIAYRIDVNRETEKPHGRHNSNAWPGITPIMACLKDLGRRADGTPKSDLQVAEDAKTAVQIIKSLHKHGADLDKSTEAGLALHYAAMIPVPFNLSVTRSLLHLGANPCIQYWEPTWKRLTHILIHVARCKYDNGGALIRALADPCNVDAKDGLDIGPLEHAYLAKNTTAFEALLHEGAQVSPLFLTQLRMNMNGGRKDSHAFLRILMRQRDYLSRGNAKAAPGAQYIDGDVMPTDKGGPVSRRRYFYDARTMNKQGRVPMFFDEGLLEKLDRNPFNPSLSWADVSVLRWHGGRTR